MSVIEELEMKLDVEEDALDWEDDLFRTEVSDRDETDEWDVDDEETASWPDLGNWWGGMS